MVISTWSLQRKWQRLQRPVALILLTSAALMLWGRSHSTTPTEPTLVAARDVPAGQVLGAEDVTVTDWPASVRPASALAGPDAVVGRRTIAAVAAGEPISQLRVVGPSALAGTGDGQVAVLLPQDPLAKAGMLRSGDHVDVVGLDGDTARTLVSAAPVLTVTEESGLLIAVPSDTAALVAQAAGTGSVAAVLRSD